MGGSSWSDASYSLRATSRASAGVPTFDYDDKVRTGAVATKVHDKMDPKNIVRECRDSDKHPETNAIIIGLDVTGSMKSIPSVLQKSLPSLLGILLRKNYITDPQILFAAVGDSRTDRVPLQVGQFEAGNEMDDDLSNIYLEGGGGGTNEEGYEALMYFALHKTKIDCVEKRGKKGYLFIIGDEAPYPDLPSNVIEKIFGDKTQPVETPKLVELLQDKYECFLLMPTGASNTGNKTIKNRWTDLFGQRVIQIENNADIPMAIAGLIGTNEGFDSVSADINASPSLSRELTTYSSKSLKKNATGLVVSDVVGIV